MNKQQLQVAVTDELIVALLADTLPLATLPEAIDWRALRNEALAGCNADLGLDPETLVATGDPMTHAWQREGKPGSEFDFTDWTPADIDIWIGGS